MQDNDPARGIDRATRRDTSDRSAAGWQLPNQGELFADPAASVIWPAVTSLSEAAQHELLRELQLRLAVPRYRDTPQRVREARAVAALREAFELLAGERAATPDDAAATDAYMTLQGPHLVPVDGHLHMTTDDYLRLRGAHPERGWPPLSTVISWLGGSWNSALRRARLPVVLGGDTLKVDHGPQYTPDECKAALKACVEDNGRVPSLSDYRRWASSDEVGQRPGRRPLTQNPFVRNFGSWEAAVHAAQLAGDGEAVLSAGRYRPVAHRYTREEISAALQEAAAVSRSPMRVCDYDHARERFMREEEQAGSPVKARPCYQVIYRIYADWESALTDAGLPTERPATVRLANGRDPQKVRWNDDQLRDAVRRAQADNPVGLRLLRRDYDQWRQRQPDARHLPSTWTIVERLGSWTALVDAIREGNQ
jgi:hypothetical protein